MTAEISSFVWMIEKLGPAFSRSDDAFSDVVGIWAAALLGLLIAGVLPGAYAIYSSERWANRLSRENSDLSTIETTVVVPVSSMILGLSVGTSGAVSLVASFGILGLKWVSEPTGVSSEFLFSSALIRSLAQLVFGLLLFRWGARGALLRAA